MVNFSGDPHSYTQPQTQDNSNHFNHPNGNYNCHNGVNAFPNPNPIDSPASGYAPPNHSRPPRKRAWTSTSPDQADGACHIKVYVAPVPRTATEADIRLVFEGHGTIVEVVLLKDKRTGGRQGSCFVKYATLDEAERAIKALNNKYTFPGESSPVVVRYADRERERLGVRTFVRNVEKKDPSEEVADKVFVSCIKKEASRNEIEEIFSAYGNIEDVFLHNRGYAFVKFSNREMAMAAIKGLNNTFTMRGCDHPLIVRFAEPKKPKTGDPRGNFLNGNGNFGPLPQESAVWPVPNFGDPNTRGSIMPMAPHHSTIAHPQVSSHMQNWEPGANMVPQPFPIQQPHSQLTSMPLQCNQAPKMSSQPFYPEVQRQLHPTDLSVQNIEQQPSSQTPTQSVSNSNTVAGSTSPDMPTSPVDDFPECDWSEHYCPDGHTYYYNCVTCESKWEKPEEYALYERGSLKQQKHEDHKESQELQEHDDHKDSQKLQEHDNHKDSQKLKELEDHEDSRNLQEHVNHKDFQKLQEHEDHKDLQKLQEHGDHNDSRRQQEHGDCNDSQRQQEHRDHTDSRKQQEHEDHKDLQRLQEHEDHKDLLRLQEHEDHNGSQRQQGHGDHNDSQKPQENENHKESQHQQEHEDHRYLQKQQENEDHKESQKLQELEDDSCLLSQLSLSSSAQVSQSQKETDNDQGHSKASSVVGLG